jgi:hypothetical protein
MHSHLGVSRFALRASRLVPGSDLDSGSLPRAPRLGALRAMPQHPIRAVAWHTFKHFTRPPIRVLTSSN